MRPVPLAVAAGSFALAGCAPGPGIETSRVELPTAEYGVAVDSEELARQPVIELHADGTLVIDGVVLTEEEQGAKGAVEKRLYDIALAAPKVRLRGQAKDPLVADRKPLLLVDRGAPFHRVEALTRKLSEVGICFPGARVAATGPRGETRWLSLGLPYRGVMVNYGGYGIEARTLDAGGVGPATVWWITAEPDADRVDPPRHEVSLADLDALQKTIRDEDPRGVLYVHAPPDTPWAQVVPAVDALLAEGRWPRLAAVGELP